MKTEILTSISDMDRDEWNSIVEPNRIICRHEYLEAIENSKINDCRYFYPVIRDEHGKLLAHTCLYFISTELDLFAKGAIKAGIQLLRKVFPNFLILRSVECGTPVALGNTISMAEGNAPAILPTLVSAAEQVAEELDVRVLLFRDFYDDELATFDAFTQKGFRRIHNLPSAHMHVRWDSFEAFVSDLRSEYRHKMRSRMAAFEKSGATMELLEDFSGIPSVLADLWSQVFERAQEYKREFLGMDFFEAIDASLGEHSAVLLARHKGKPIGFMLQLFSGDTLIPLFCGLDYAVNRETYTYFNLFYRSIELAVARGLKTIDFGITTIDPKLEFGAHVVTQYMYMKHTGPGLRSIVPRLFDEMTPQPRVLSKDVFRRAQ